MSEKGNNKNKQNIKLPKETSFDYDVPPEENSGSGYSKEERDYFVSQTKKNNAINWFYKILSGIGVVITAVVVFWVAVWAFNVGSIAKPVGSLEKAVELLEKDINRLFNSTDENTKDIQEVEKKIIELENKK